MRIRLLAASLAVSAGFMLGATHAAMAAIPGTYSVSTQQGKSFSLLSGANHDLISSITDDSLIPLSTANTGPSHLPFRLPAYGQTYANAQVSSNGDLTLGSTGGSSAFGNTALPSASFTAPTLFPFWDDLFFDPSDTSHFFAEGIFTKTSGTAPHRTFVVSWQGHAFNNEQYLVLAQVRFSEGSQTIRYRYGASDNQGVFSPSETIGIQLGGLTHFRQIAFDPPAPGAVVSGTQFTLTHS